MARPLIGALILAGTLAAGTAGAGLPETEAPRWHQLSVKQKEVLAPLAEDWDQLDGVRRRKWVGVADRFYSLTPDEQARIHSRMREWAQLSPSQRRNARDQYKSLRQLPPDQREALIQKWNEYENLSPEEKKRLSESRPTPKASAVSPLGLRPAPRPAASAKAEQPGAPARPVR